jgi:phosphonate utilization transcriptional regulator
MQPEPALASGQPFHPTDMILHDALALLRTQSLPNLVQEQIERLILDGTLKPGEPLREMTLAKTLGVSRGPVREAFRGLEEKGLVRVEKNCGVQVRRLSHAEADQIYEVRITLEALIGRKVAENIAPAGLARLSDILDQMASAAQERDINPYTSLNLIYHDTLARLSGNPQLHETYSRLVAQLSLFRRRAYMHDKQSMALSLREHRAIYQALGEGDAERASRLLRDHAEDSRRRMHEALLPSDSAG